MRGSGSRSIGPAAAVALALLLIAAGPSPDPVSRLAWLSGDWVSDANGRWTEEQWNAPRGGLMLGVGRSGKAERAMGFEFMRIAADADGRLVFWGSPGGSGAVPFRLVEEGETSATFANPRHDFPKRITYRRDGERLIAVVAGDDPAGTQSWTYHRREPSSGPDKRKAARRR